MALADSLNQFARKSPSYKAGVIFLAVLGVGVVYYQLVYSGMVEERDALVSSKESLLREQSKLTKDLAENRRLAQQAEDLQRSVRDNQRALPTAAELPAFFDYLQRKAGDAGVNIRHWERIKEEQVDIYVKVPVKVEVNGTFNGIKKYFSLLGPRRGSGQGSSAEQDGPNERIVSIENLELKDARVQDGDIVLSASFLAVTFRQPDGGDPLLSPTAQQQPSGGAVGKAVREREAKVEKASGTAAGGDRAAPPAAGGDKTKQGTDRLKSPGADIQ